MTRAHWGVLYLGMTGCGVLGDVSLKRTGVAPAADRRWFAVGLLCYAGSSFGWLPLLTAAVCVLLGGRP